MHKVYLVYAEIGNVGQWKIGVTGRDIDSRLLELRTGNPNIVGAVATYEIVDEKMAYKVEAYLLKRLKHDNIGGEWHSFDCIDKERFLDMCKKAETNLKIADSINKNIKRYS